MANCGSTSATKKRRTDDSPDEPNRWKSYYKAENAKSYDLQLKIQEMEQNIEQLKNNNQYLTEELSRYEESSNSMTKELIHSKKTIDGLKTKVTEEEERAQVREKAAQTLEDRYSNARKLLDDKDKTIVDLNAKITSLDEKTTRIVVHINNKLKTCEESHKRELEVRDQTIDALRAEKTTLEKNLKRQTVDTNEEAKKYKTMRDNAIKQMEKMAKDLNDLKKSKESVEELNRELRRLSVLHEEKYIKAKDWSEMLAKKCDKLDKSREDYKRRLLAIKHTLVKTKNLYVNVTREVAKDGIQLNNGLAEKIVESVGKFFEETQRDYRSRFATRIETIAEEMEGIEIEEQRITEERSDGRVSCGSCDRTFGRSGDLQRHMTTTHKINRSIVKTPVIQLD